MDYPCVFLVRLNRFLCIEVPDVDDLVVAGHHIRCCGRKLAVTNPVVMLLQCVLQTPIDCGPNLDQFIVAAGSQEKTIAGESNPPDACIVGLDECDFFRSGVEIDFPKFDGLVAAC